MLRKESIARALADSVNRPERRPTGTATFGDGEKAFTVRFGPDDRIVEASNPAMIDRTLQAVAFDLFSRPGFAGVRISE